MAYDPSQPSYATHQYEHHSNFYQPPQTTHQQSPSDHMNQQHPPYDILMLSQTLEFAQGRIDSLIELLRQKELDNQRLIETNQSLSESNKTLSAQIAQIANERNDLVISMLSQILKNSSNNNHNISSTSSSTDDLRFTKKSSLNNGESSASTSSSVPSTKQQSTTTTQQVSLKRPLPIQTTTSQKTLSGNEKSTTSSTQRSTSSTSPTSKLHPTLKLKKLITKD